MAPTTKTKEPDTCQKCKFFEQSRFHKDHGVCNRYPTSVNKHITEWCGEFQPKEK